MSCLILCLHALERKGRKNGKGEGGRKREGKEKEKKRKEKKVSHRLVYLYNATA